VNNDTLILPETPIVQDGTLITPISYTVNSMPPTCWHSTSQHLKSAGGGAFFVVVALFCIYMVLRRYYLSRGDTPSLLSMLVTFMFSAMAYSSLDRFLGDHWSIILYYLGLN
jgi:hypothetical protein